jgi:hypothetical protein
MRKRKRISQACAEPYSEQQLAGLREHTQAQKQNTVSRLEAAIASLTAQHKPISARTIYEECGLEYASIRRNPEALLLYQQHSTFLKRERKRTRTSCPDTLSPRNPLLAYKKTQLVAMIREERARQQETEKQQAQLLQDYVQKDVKIAQLETELAQYRSYLERLRIQIQQQEHGN